MAVLWVTAGVLMVINVVAYSKDWIKVWVSEVLSAVSLSLIAADRFIAHDPFTGWLFVVIALICGLPSVRVTVTRRRVGEEDAE